MYKVTLSGCICRYGGSDLRAAISLARLVEVTATRKAVFKEIRFSEHIAIGSNGGLVMASKTSGRDHWGAMVWEGGHIFWRPFKNLLSVGLEKSLAEYERGGWCATIAEM